MQTVFYLNAHIFRPWFRTADRSLQLDLINRALRFQCLRNMQQIARRTGNSGCAEILHHIDKLFRVARRHRDDRRAKVLRAVVRAEPARKQPVTVCHLDDIRFCDACL